MLNSRMVDPWAIAAAVMLLLLALAQAIPAAPVLRLQNTLFDFYQVLMPREHKSAPVTIVAVDEGSLAKLGQWPWPRSLLARLFERIAEGKPAAVGVDAFFPEPDRYSPGRIADYFRDRLPASVVSQFASLPDGDRQLADAFRSAPLAIGVSGERDPTPESPKLGPTPLVAPADPASLNGYAGHLQSLKPLHDSAAGRGLFNTPADSWDGVTRQVPIVARVGDVLVLGMSAEVLRLGTGATPRLGAAHGGLRSLQIAESTVRVQENGNAWVHFRRHDPRVYVTASDVIDGKASEMLRDKLVLFGIAGLGVLDYKLTPLGEYIPGVEVHAQMIEQVFDDRTLARPSWMRFVEAAATLGLGIAIAVLARLAQLRIAVLTLTGALALAACVAVGAFLYGTLVDVATPALGWAASFSLALAGSLATARKAREKAVYMFSRFVNPHVVRELLKDESLASGGQERRVTLLFTDIRNFTQLSERQAPTAIVEMLNAYFSRQVEVVFRHKGALDKFIGDAMMVFWGAPLDDPAHAQSAVRCALELADEALRFRESLGEAGAEFDIGIGLHTGQAVVGLIGSEQRREYTAIGPVVNVASRVEGLTKKAKHRILVTRETMEACGDAEFDFEAVGAYQVKGVERPIEVFAPRRKPVA